MTRAFDSVVIGGDANGLVAAIALAQHGSKVLLLESHAELGGSLREIEFAPGFRAAPLASDAGYVDAEVARLLGSLPATESTADPAVVSLGDGEPLVLNASVDQTAQGLSRFSAKDAQRWPDFTARMHALAGFLGALYREPAPRIDTNTAGEFFSLAKLGRKFRGLGTTNMVELLRTLPMALGDLLDDWFESDRLKGTLAALGVMDVGHGPVSGGTAFTFLHRQVGARRGVFSERLRFKGGAGALVAALSQRAHGLGVIFEGGSSVRETAIRDGRIAGVTLASGETIACKSVFSSLDPYRSLLELVDPVHLDPGIHSRGPQHPLPRGDDEDPRRARLLAGVAGTSRLPSRAPLSSRLPRGTSSARTTPRNTGAARTTRSSSSDSRASRSRVSLRPASTWAVLHVQFTPYRLREGGWDQMRDSVADRAFAVIEQHVPGFTARVRARQVLSPVDIESAYGLREGALSQGEMMLDQLLFMRPVPGYSRYAMPIPGFFLCGAGTHPGAGATGLPGLLAARAALPR